MFFGEFGSRGPQSTLCSTLVVSPESFSTQLRAPLLAESRTQHDSVNGVELNGGDKATECLAVTTDENQPGQVGWVREAS